MQKCFSYVYLLKEDFLFQTCLLFLGEDYDIVYCRFFHSLFFFIKPGFSAGMKVVSLPTNTSIP